MKNSNYIVHLIGDRGNIKRDISEFIELQYARTLNSIGSLTIILPSQIQDIYRDQMIVVYRQVGDKSPVISMNTVWFVNGIQYDYQENTTKINAVDALSLIKRRIVAYLSGTPEASKTIENGIYLRADDLIKAFVRENIGALAPLPRRMISFSVDKDLGKSPFTEKEAAWRNLLEVISDIADEQTSSGNPLYFDVIPNGNVYSFRFITSNNFLNKDNRSKIQFNPDLGNIENVSLEIDWSEYINCVYVGGDGQDELRLVEEYSDGSFASTRYHRSEFFLDMRDELDSSVMEKEAYSVMRARKTRKRMTGDIVDGFYFYYGIDYEFGDLVKCIYGEHSFDAIISSVSITISENSGEKISVSLSGES